MKTRYNLFAVLLCLALSAGSAFGQLTGTKTINPSGAGPNNFVSFKQAIDTLNFYGVGTDGVTFVIANGTYTEAGTLTINPTANKPSAANPVTFMVNVGAMDTLHLPGTANNYSFTIGTNTNSVDYVTIDGWNGTGRGLTIINDGPDGSNGFLVYGDHTQFKNFKYAPSAPISKVATIGIMLHDAMASDYGTIYNCDITSNYGIMVGSGATVAQVGTLVQGNTIHCLLRGIYANRTTDITIRNNEVIGSSTIYPNSTTQAIYASNSKAAAAGNIVIDANKVHDFGINNGVDTAITITGIYIGSAGATYTVSGNKIYNLYNGTSNAKTNVQVQGITTASGDQSTKCYIFNNFIYGLEDNDIDAAGNWTAGIRPNTAGKMYVYHNTVFVKHTSRNHATAAFICGGGIDTKDTNYVFNNIFYVDQSGPASYKSFCVYRGGSFKGVLISDYNLLVNNGTTGTQSVIGDPNGNTLALWQANNTAALPLPDAHSVCKEVVFADSVTDLHLAGASLGDHSLMGVSIDTLIAKGVPASLLTTDIDGNPRNASYPYMGADESLTNPLPVEVTSFTAHASAKGALLSWQTATEVNNRGFAVERRAVVSGGSNEWQQVGFVQGAGTSNASHSYSYSDQVAMPGKYAYRLKQMDNDGAFKYYNEIEVMVGAVREFKLYGNYPNPFNPSTAVRFTVSQDGPAEMKVFNAIGQEVATIFNGYAQAGVMQEATFNASAMPSGMYFARLKSGSSVSVIKMMLMK